jgi:hypothetical protein
MATGMAAVHASMLSHLKTGDRVVASRALFGSCHWIVSTLLPRYGIQSEFVDCGDLDQWKRALSTPANLVLLETPSNPMLELVDMAAIAVLAALLLWRPLPRALQAGRAGGCEAKSGTKALARASVRLTISRSVRA